MSDVSIERIRWVDSLRHDEGWRTKQHYVDECKAWRVGCETVGYVFFEDKTSVGVAQSRNRGSLTDVIQIPKVAITSRKRLS